MDAALSLNASEDVDGRAALALAESLGVPLATKNADLASDSAAVLRC